MKTTVFYCDRCGEAAPPRRDLLLRKRKIGLYYQFSGSACDVDYDLCDSCVKKFRSWMKEGEKSGEQDVQ